MEIQKIQSAHDRFFRESMERIPIAQGMIETFVNDEILKNVDINGLEIVIDDWVDEELKEYRADILYLAPLLYKQGSIYFLFEHKSYSDRNTLRQLYRYKNRIWETIEKQSVYVIKLPVIIPIIIYHGKRLWNTGNSMKPEFVFFKGVEDFVPDLEYILVDLFRFDDENITDKSELKTFLLTLKYSRTPEIFQILPEIIRSFKDKEDIEYLKVALVYIGSLIPKTKINKFFEMVRKEHEDGAVFMESIVDALRKEGWIKGKREGKKEGEKEGKIEGKIEGKVEGKIEVAQNMLSKGMNIELICEITGLSVQKIRELQRKKNK